MTNELRLEIFFSLKYEVFLESGSEEQHAAVNGVVEIEIGTSRNPSGQNSNDNASGATNQTSEIGKRKSVMSLVSMLSLPPAYSQLHSRSGSMMSLETCEWFMGLNSIRNSNYVVFPLRSASTIR